MCATLSQLFLLNGMQLLSAATMLNLCITYATRALYVDHKSSLKHFTSTAHCSPCIKHRAKHSFSHSRRLPTQRTDCWLPLPALPWHLPPGTRQRLAAGRTEQGG
jgi:hypothetical protein